MRKKLLGFIFAICLIIPCVLIVGCTKDKELRKPEPVNEVMVLFSEDGKTLYRFAPDNDETEYTVPDGVETIGASAFANCDNLTKVVLPTTLKYIRDDAFSSCANISNIEINSDISIGEKVFCYCSKLDTIDFSKIISFGDYAFYSCYAITSATIAREVYFLPEGIFSHANNLTTVNFETNSTLNRIGDNAFVLTGITSINLPTSCTDIGDFAFRNTKLTSIEISKNIETIGCGAFMSGGELITVNFETGRTKDIWFGEFNSFLGYYEGGHTFASCSNLTSVINYPMTGVLRGTFDGCHELQTFTFSGERLTTWYSLIGTYAFMACRKLNEISIPDIVSGIEENAFALCSIQKVTVESEEVANSLINVELIGDATTVYIKTGLTVTNSTYLLKNFTKQATSDKTGYDMYVRNAE